MSYQSYQRQWARLGAEIEAGHFGRARYARAQAERDAATARLGWLPELGQRVAMPRFGLTCGVVMGWVPDAPYIVGVSPIGPTFEREVYVHWPSGEGTAYSYDLVPERIGRTEIERRTEVVRLIIASGGAVDERREEDLRRFRGICRTAGCEIDVALCDVLAEAGIGMPRLRKECMEDMD